MPRSSSSIVSRRTDRWSSVAPRPTRRTRRCGPPGASRPSAKPHRRGAGWAQAHPPASRGPLRAPEPRPDFGGPVLFHYTRPDAATAIFDQREYAVSSKPDPEFGTGFWVTDIAPNGLSDEDLRRALFPDRPVEYVHGVVVVARRPEFRQVREHEFLWPLAAGTGLDLRQVAVAVGRKTKAGWRFRTS